MTVPRGTLRPWVVPGAPTWHELRWAWRVRRAPVLESEYATRVEVADREELIGCDLCGERRAQPLRRPHAHDGRWSYRVVRCRSCGVLYRNPGIRPERLGELYGGGGYGAFLTGAYARCRGRRYRVVMDAFSPLFDEGRGRRLLHFGCGAGIFLDVAHRRGFACHGVDLSPDAVEGAHRTLQGSQPAASTSSRCGRSSPTWLVP